MVGAADSVLLERHPIFRVSFIECFHCTKMVKIQDGEGVPAYATLKLTYVCMHVHASCTFTYDMLKSHIHMRVCMCVRTYVHTCVSVQLTAINDNNRDDQSIDPNDTSHDDRDDRLHDEVRPHHSHSGDTHPTLGCAVSCTNCYQGVERGGGGGEVEINQLTTSFHACAFVLCLTHTFNALLASWLHYGHIVEVVELYSDFRVPNFTCGIQARCISEVLE